MENKNQSQPLFITIIQIILLVVIAFGANRTSSDKLGNVSDDPVYKFATSGAIVIGPQSAVVVLPRNVGLTHIELTPLNTQGSVFCKVDDNSLAIINSGMVLQSSSTVPRVYTNKVTPIPVGRWTCITNAPGSSTMAVVAR